MINENSKLRYLGRFDTLKEAAPRCLRGPTSKSIAPHPNPPKQWRMQRKPTTKRKTVMPKRIWTAILGTKVRRNKWLVAAVRFWKTVKRRGEQSEEDDAVVTRDSEARPASPGGQPAMAMAGKRYL